MVVPSKPPANAFVATLRKVYNPIGFGKGYNFILWLTFSGTMMGFSLSRSMFLNYNGIFCGDSGSSSNHAAPGECWRYSKRDIYKIGIQLHLYTIIPAGILVCFQFVPIIRHRAILVHRINGYVVLFLSLVSTAGAFIIAPVSFGGGIEIQVVIGLLSIMFVVSLAISYYNVKRLQLEQHRAWMLRAWFYVCLHIAPGFVLTVLTNMAPQSGSIITCRLIMGISAMLTSMQNMGPYYKALPCEELATFYSSTKSLVDVYPECESLAAWAAVKADLAQGSEENTAASLNLAFGMALWLGLALHAIGIEVYVCMFQQWWLFTISNAFLAATYTGRGGAAAQCVVSATTRSRV